MTLLEFFQHTLPTIGAFNVFTTADRRNRWARSHEELADVVQSLALS